MNYTKMKKLNMITSVMIFMIFVSAFVPLVLADLRFGFYNASCPQAEQIIRQVVQKRFKADRSVTAGLLRMHFHDCFVRVSKSHDYCLLYYYFYLRPYNLGQFVTHYAK